MPRRHRRLLGVLLAALAVLASAAAGAIVTGRAALVVTHGVSMNPVYFQGDLVVVIRKSTYRAGDIVAYRRQGHSDVVLHRIVSGGPQGWVFKGDNNPTVDPTKPVASQLVGRAAFHLSGGGLWLRRLTGPSLVAGYAFLLFVAGGGAVVRRHRHRHRKERAAVPPRHRAKPARTLAALPHSLRPAVAATAVVGVVGLALGGLAWTAPTDRTAPTSHSVTSAMAFSYTAQVRRSAAYDGTVVTAPQPVFRRLADRVEVSYAYTGQPGRLTVRADLSTVSGWQTSVPLGAATIGPRYNGSVTLDLAALERRATAASTVTGVPMSNVRITVVPEVAASGGGTFTPKLELTLEPLTLTATSALTVKGSTKTTGTRVVAATLSAAGRSVAVRTVRLASLVAIAVVLLAAAVVVLIARLTGPVPEADRIRARHGQLILPVMPMALQPGRPVVDVPDIDSLVRLAERYGLLVLHWSRGGIDTYLVQDEGTTFRYRRGDSATARTNDQTATSSSELAVQRGTGRT